MPHTEITTSPKLVVQRTKPVLAREFVSGAVLGASIWLALRTLGFNDPMHLSGSSGLLPSVLLGGLLGLSRYRVMLWLAGSALVTLFAIVSFTPLVVQPAQALIRSDPLPSPPLSLDAVVVLSGGVTSDGYLVPDAVDRMLSGMQLAKATGTSVLVTTRLRNPRNLEITSDADQHRLFEMMGSGLRLFTVRDVFSTRDEAIAVRDLAAEQGWARIAVVTSPAHSRRACGTFEKVGLRVTCVPADSRRVALRTLNSPDDRVLAFELWLYELVGTTQHRLRGWLP